MNGPTDRESGTIALVPWERSGKPWHVRLLDTVHATTCGAPTFFRTLPDGFVAPAFRFAAAAEVLAVGSTALALLPLVLLAIPGLLLRCLLYATTRQAVVWTTVVGVAGFSLILIVAHCLHGLLLGGRTQRALALRMGLYACGWDFGSSPAGLVSIALRSGLRRALGVFSASLRAPTVGVDAALAGPLSAHRLSANRVRRRAFIVSLTCILPLVVALFVSMIWIALRAP